MVNHNNTPSLQQQDLENDLETLDRGPSLASPRMWLTYRAKVIKLQLNHLADMIGQTLRQSSRERRAFYGALGDNIYQNKHEKADVPKLEHKFTQESK